MKYLAALVLCFLTTVALHASSGYGLWCNGKITLEDGEVLEGEINYDLKFEVIQVKNNGMIRAFSPESVSHFTIFDPVKYRQREFVSLEFEITQNYKRKTFFEVIANGHLTVLRKSRYIRRPRITEDYRSPHVYLNTICKHQYFVLKEEAWTEIDNFNPIVLSWMNDLEHEIDHYIDKHQLKLRTLQEKMRVVNVYNQLSDNRKTLAAYQNQLFLAAKK